MSMQKRNPSGHSKQNSSTHSITDKSKAQGPPTNNPKTSHESVSTEDNDTNGRLK